MNTDLAVGFFVVLLLLMLIPETNMENTRALVAETTSRVQPVVETQIPAFIEVVRPVAPQPVQVASVQDGLPYGCPVQPASGSVVMTQGYGVGSHAPASVWGAVDLAIDGNGDGYAEPGPSYGAPLVATHDGVATVTMNSYPGGNYVSIIKGGLRTGYAHLQDVFVVSGQHVRAGDQIGTMGSTGMSSGPHLDYGVWLNGVNTDPTPLVQSCFQ